MTRMHVKMTPHNASPSQQREQAAIYRRGQTPLVDAAGQLHAVPIRPAGPEQTGRQLDELARSHGPDGVARSVRGLAATRGDTFAQATLRYAAPAVARMGADPPSPQFPTALGDDLASAMSRSSQSAPLPGSVRDRLESGSGHSFARVRVHDDSAAHQAAAGVHARAFTVGRDVYFGAGEYRPDTTSGLRLLAHEAGHTVQQGDAVARGPLEVTSPGDSSEREVDRFADAIVDGTPAPPITPQPFTAARVQRVISFTRSNDVFATNSLRAGPSPGGWAIQTTATPLFSWTADVTIHGSPGDAFGNWEIGPLNVVREAWIHITWGTGADRTRRRSNLNHAMRDEAPGSGTPWYSNWRAAGPFTGDGNTQTTTLADSPGWGPEPWTNPLPPRGGDLGWFSYGAAFVGYISARDTTAGTTAAAYRATGCVYWNAMLDGHWDNRDPVATRMHTTGGAVRRGGVIGGASPEFPSMHGGTAALTTFLANLRTI
jgi:hypothetical protein